MLPDLSSLRENYTELTQLVTTFALGLVFGSSSWSLGWLIVFIIVYEIALFLTLGSDRKYWRGFMRVGLNCASILGLLLGDWIINDETFLDSFVYDIPSRHGESLVIEWMDPFLVRLNSWTR
jgi:hypothetical protein